MNPNLQLGSRLFFQPSHVACRILVPQQEIEPRPPQSKCRVLTQSLLKFLSIESVMLPSHLNFNKCELFLPPRISSSMLNSLSFLCKSRYPLLHCCCLSLAPWALVEVSWLIEAGGCYRLWGGSLLVKLTIPWCSSWVRSLSLFNFWNIFSIISVAGTSFRLSQVHGPLFLPTPKASGLFWSQGHCFFTTSPWMNFKRSANPLW